MIWLLARCLIVCGLLPAILSLAAASEEAKRAFRPPAVPLVTSDPYFSIWSCADHLTDDATRHWTHTRQALTGLIRIDGQAFRLMGDTPQEVPALPQVGLQVLPTRTIYEFEGAQVHVTLTFMTPRLPGDLEVLARPVTYLTWDVHATDGQSHSVALYCDASAEIAVNTPDEPVVWSRQKMGRLIALRIGSEEQPVLQKKGDNLRIDWGYLYAAAPQNGALTALGSGETCARNFCATEALPDREDMRMPRAVSDDLPVVAFAFPLGNVGATSVSHYLMLAYDDVYAIDYFGSKLRPYWRRHGAEAADLLQNAARDYRALRTKCAAFDTELMTDLVHAGGENYAHLAALSYRQCLAGTGLAADANGQPLLFPKENTSNGCIGTVDVIYPMDPLFLLFSPTLAKASLAGVLSYSASPRWTFPFAPHDLGTYPQATGQVYGGGEKTEVNQMPVEESGNMILLLVAIAKHEGNAEFASRYWPQVTRWAEYLEAKGFDPENQLCTDDFAGHLAHNANLSIKAIEALAAYGKLCGMRGDAAAATRYQALAKEMAARWVQAAQDGDHYRLAFDRPDTWSQKYNLVWDKILDLNLFPAEVTRTEMTYYRQKLNRYGLPLDNRRTYAKTDWSLWTATLATTRDDFEALVAPIYDFLNDTPDRVPLSDFYWTENGHDAGMHARPVIGGVFIKLLSDPALWKKWASRDKSAVGEWRPVSAPPQIREVIPTAQHAPVLWRYTITQPAPNWTKPDFDDSGWQEGPAGFGTPGTPNTTVRTLWQTSDIWIRRECTLPDGAFPDLQVWAYHDEDMEVYINGVLAAQAPGYITDYELFALRPAARAALKPGKNVLAVHCHQTVGGQFIDVGLAEVVPSGK